MKVFIPIKEHSQRVPRKNFRNFGGAPLYQYVIDKWVGIEGVDVFVDTDSNEVLDWVWERRFENILAYGRRKPLCGDKVSVNSLIKNCIEHNHIDREDVLAQIHVTSPFLKPETVMSNIPCCADSISSANVIQSRLWMNDIPLNHNPLELKQTQDLPKVYEENSAFYIFKVGAFLDCGNRITGNHCFVEIDETESMDIDTEEDWEQCVKQLESK